VAVTAACGLAISIGIALGAAPAGATSIACLEGFRASYLALDPAQSAIFSGGAPQPLRGRIRVEVGSLPLTGATSFEIVQVDVAGGGYSARLDPEIASAGLGVLFGDRSFLVPTLFLRVSLVKAGRDFEFALANLTGTLELDPLCGNTVTRLTSSFEVDEGPVVIVATPEPRAGALAAAAALALVLCRRAREAVR
jgi:hypothetical protein